MGFLQHRLVHLLFRNNGKIIRIQQTTFLIRFRYQEYRCEITRTVPLSEPDKSVLQGI